MKSPALTAEQILRALTRRHFYDGRPPKRALKEASRRRDEMLPLFLNEIEKFLSASSKERVENPTPLLLIFFALGEWGDHGAYRPLARLIRCPEFTDHPGFESVFDEVGHRVIVSVFDGDPEPLFAAVRDPKAHRIARHNILTNTLAMLAYHERIGREAIANFLIDAYGQLDDHPIVWLGWATLAARLDLSALRPLVIQAIREERFDGYEIEEFDEDLKSAIIRPGSSEINEDFSPFEGAYEELKVHFP
ncbi:DUF1186 domain-containing protein [Methylosinus sp. Sm6]|uniref:DUF1186 domain-containing protein n=1 Tax=Methylosinus sp. Sm6 TaxID=2866948 RepID=UPI001C98E987|nr:DUF1186 domain-containing protein [Methylosinus sp. Sm6]MBY6240404.1 DUF1186 family protein [Methylosinus sp. Sm6]